MAERYTAIHAARSLAATVTGVERLLHFTKIGYSFMHRTVASLLARYAEKCFGVSHKNFLLEIDSLMLIVDVKSEAP